MPAKSHKKAVTKPSSKEQIVWLDGKLVEESKTRVPILTHSLQYGSGIFEGIRAYKTARGPAIFRLNEHVKRFFKSAKVYNMPLSCTPAELFEAVVKVVRANSLDACYIRPFGFYNEASLGVSSWGRSTSVFVGAIPFGAYFGGGKENGIKCIISSWQRINSLILPPEAKASGNYINSILANTEAKMSGADEAILTSIDGLVAEGPGENIFLVEEGKIITPSRDADILLGITRDTIIKIAEAKGLEVIERNVHKEELYTCDEAFFCGTAAEVTPIVSVDGRIVGKGKPGSITKLLSDSYEKIVTGNSKEFGEWLTYV